MENYCPKTLGTKFEIRVRNAFLNNEYFLIKQNQWMKNYSRLKDDAKKREFDIIMFNRKEREVYIIECKAHYKKDTFVRTEQVSEFYNKLQLYDGYYAKRLMVTDTDFTNQAKKYAKEKNILTMNGKELRKIERQIKPISSISNRIISKGLEKIVKIATKELKKLMN